MFEQFYVMIAKRHVGNDELAFSWHIQLLIPCSIALQGCGIWGQTYNLTDMASNVESFAAFSSMNRRFKQSISKTHVAT